MHRLLHRLHHTSQAEGNPSSSFLSHADSTTTAGTATATPHPVPLPHRGRAHYEGHTVMGNAVVDLELPPDLPLELVPPEEAMTAATVFLHEGGCFLFSDDYVHKYPHSKVSEMIRVFHRRRKGEKEDGCGDGTESPEDDDPLSSITTAGATPSNASLSSLSSANEPKDKLQQVRDIIREARAADRPIFRRLDPTVIYGESQYIKRNFHATLDEEYSI